MHFTVIVCPCKGCIDYSVTNSLNDCDLITEGSGANIKYYIQKGADAASKKLLGKIPVKIAVIDNVTAGYSGFVKSYSISSLTTQFKELTSNNFFLDLYYINDVYNRDYNDSWGAYVTKQYNAANGTLTISIPLHSNADVCGEVSFRVIGVW